MAKKLERVMKLMIVIVIKIKQIHPCQRWFSATRFDYNGAYKSHDLLKIQGLSLVEILFVKINPLQDLLSNVNAVISTNERH